ncbi:Protein of unknown function [Parapedobacter composti]|uniref:DUF4876 domain-containing protein n=1 Tax=Parapedobacter composti TaxID=623281 RepID=A0A1I1IXS1_9SPHI|nr:DUF4876 domain-containing protein [Parapedobacter composti]SFC39148.1 Protein of unknown function [Parapedobacter composti]
MKQIALFLIAAAGFMACKRDNPDVVPVNLTVQVTHSLSLTEQNAFPYEQVAVTIRNLQNGSETTQQVGNNGQVTFAAIPVGRYDVTAAVTLRQADYLQLTGIDPGADVSLNASVLQQEISVGFANTIELELISGTQGAFVLKQIYYGGSDNRDGALFRDQFVEIYNNTGEVLYADGLYIARLWGRQRPDTDGHHFQANGQFDWSRSKDMPAHLDANRDYVYLRDLLRIPGDGNTYPVQPGESIIIAQNALNHKTPYTGHNGREISVRNPDLTVDLSGADFEVYYGDLPGRTPFNSDIDNPSVPNMVVIKHTGNDWILDNNGRDSYVIFRAENGLDVTALPEYFAPSLNEPNQSANTYIQLPISYIMDAVEVQPTPMEDRIPKKLQPQHDAGYTFVTGGAYSSQAVMRRVKETVNGRKVLQDANNSSADFVSIKANPRGFAE